jgi:hypothetical protein
VTASTVMGTSTNENSAIAVTPISMNLMINIFEVMVLGGNGHKLNVSLIDYENDFEQQIDLGARLRMPVSGHKTRYL